jgi:hypothetical protein
MLGSVVDCQPNVLDSISGIKKTKQDKKKMFISRKGKVA